MQIDINLVKKLRDTTFAPLGDCKNALVEGGGDLEKAQAILKEKGIAKAGKKADRETNEGLVKVAEDAGYTMVIKILCETDFVAKNDTFLQLFDNVFAVLKNVKKKVNSVNDLDTEVLEKINNLLAEAVGTIGENLKLGEVYITDENVFAYTHPGSRVISLVAFSGDQEIAKELALQVAALNPEYLTFDEVPAEEKEKLVAQFTEELKASGKPENMIPQIVKGKVEKAFSDTVLLEQEYIRDGAKKVKDLLTADFKVTGFKRFAI